MKNKAIYFFFSVLLFQYFAVLSAQTVLSPKVLENIQSSVFEVVVEKLKEGKTEYDRELPLERLPFAVRNDKFSPLGTAFLLNDGTFYSASHVFDLYGKTQYKNYYIRDKDGKVYLIDTVLKMSTDRDYISFTVKDFIQKKGSGLEPINDFKMNSQVFSVGNALGEGIIIRDGLLVNHTFNQDDGEWEWLRFTAAASPGNSGGPLVNLDGKVLGIITMKDNKENLNYALPFSETNALPKNTGLVKIAFYYGFPNLTLKPFFYKYKNGFPLPQKINDLQASLTKHYADYISQIVTSLRKQYAPTGKQGFAVSTEKDSFFDSRYMTTYPFLIFQNSSGKWSYCTPSDRNDYELENKVVVRVGDISGYTFVDLKKPDSMSLKELVSNPKTYFDYILAAIPNKRIIGDEKVLITSLGKPCNSTTYIDYFDRTWLVNYWELSFADEIAVSYALPLPQGLFIIFKIDTTANVFHTTPQQISFLADFIYNSYRGNLKEWTEFLSLPESLVGQKAPFLKKLQFSSDDKHTIVSNGTFNVDIPQTLYAVDDESVVEMSTSFQLNNSKLVLESRTFSIMSNLDTKDYRSLYLGKSYKPADSASLTLLLDWQQQINATANYSGEPYNSHSYTYIDKILYPTSITYQTRNKADYVYVLSMELAGTGRNQEILDYVQRIEDSKIFVDESNITDIQ